MAYKQVRISLNEANEGDVEIYEHLIKMRNVSAYIKSLIANDLKEHDKLDNLTLAINKLADNMVNMSFTNSQANNEPEKMKVKEIVNFDTDVEYDDMFFDD